MKKRFTPDFPTAGAVWNKCMLALTIALMSSLSAGLYGQSVLLRDIDESEDHIVNEFSEITSGGGRVYFVEVGKELWTGSPTSETPDQLILLKTFISVSGLTAVGTNLYFVADDGVSGPELWKTNGTSAGTVRVKDIRPGASGSEPSALTNVRGVLYFSADDGVNGRELWKTNGSPLGTVLVKDILAGGNSNPSSLTEVSGTLFFAANNGPNGVELWKSNGMADGTVMVKDIREGTRVNSWPRSLVNVYGTLFFVASDATAGRELWKSDGTAGGTVRIKDILPGTKDSRINNATAVYRTLYFTATDGIHGHELWKSDGTEGGTVMVKDMNPGAAGSHGVDSDNFDKANFRNIYGTLFFTAYHNDVYYVWKSNGTEKGTVPLFECRGPGIAHPRPMFTFMNDRVYFFNRQWEEEYEPIGFWSMNRYGTDVQLIVEFFVADAYNPYYPGLVLVDDTFYLTGRPDFWRGFRMLRSDGTSEGTVLLEDINTRTDGSYPEEFHTFNGHVYFRADHTFYHQDDLWRTDGTPEGTELFFNYDDKMVESELVGNYLYASTRYSFGLYKTNLLTREGEFFIPPDYTRTAIKFLRQLNGRLVFATESGELWTSDGTQEGTVPIMDFHQIIALDPAGDKILFRVVHADYTEELWRSDGTVPGTFRVKTLQTGLAGFSSVQAVTIGNIYYFAVNDAIHGKRVWRSDGTEAGTHIVADLNTSVPPAQDDIRHLTVFDDHVYISAQGNEGVWGLYKTDGTVAGTQLVHAISPIGSSVVMSGQLYLLTDEYAGSSITNLWITDGTGEGTQLLKEMNAPYGRFSHDIVDGVLYFSTLEGGPLWRTDGTTCGTFIIDIGSVGASPIKALNTILIFGSYDEQAGYEPHAYNTAQAPASPCATAVALSVEEPQGYEENILSGYPNPFTNDFALRIEDNDADRVHLKVFTLYGKPVEDIAGLATNTDHRLGQSWSRGVYVLQVIRRDRIEQHMVVKE